MKVYILLLFISFKAFAIVGGMPAPVSDIPYVAHIRIGGDNGTNCTAVLVARDTLLTALHCVMPELFNHDQNSERSNSVNEALAKGNLNAQNLLIRFAQTETFQANMVKSLQVSNTVYTIIEEAIQRGPAYQIFSGHDWAILKLKNAVDFNPISIISSQEYFEHYHHQRNVYIYGIGAVHDPRILRAIVAVQNWLQLSAVNVRSELPASFYEAKEKLELIVNNITNEHIHHLPPMYKQLLDIYARLNQFYTGTRSSQNRMQRELNQLLSVSFMSFMSSGQSDFNMASQGISMSDARSFLILNSIDNTLTGACNGDSGGPAVAHINGRHVLIGLNTATEFCGHSTRVTPLIDLDLSL